ncbi:MAG: cytochrome c3 family protein [Anaerolineales bacterium]
MQTNRLGCLTSTGIFATLITLALIAGFGFVKGEDLFSPGELNNQIGESMGGVSAHAQITECESCHTAPWETARMADRCVVCHTEIAQQMFDVAQLHGAITQKNSTLACRDCHPEHRGETASLTDLGNNVFPHEALGFSLQGHQVKANREAFLCSDCHGDNVSTFASDSCQSCHSQMDIAFTQAHLLSFGTDCLACHDGVDRYGDDFNHNQFTFKLTGEHANASCTNCHLDARSVTDLQNTPQTCSSCHQKDDPHAGAFGTDCGACHSAEGWTPAKFDHNLSTFKLEGKHAEVQCESCHQNNVFKGTPTDCYSCHQKDDEHHGQNGTDCATCHNPSSWDDASFDHSGFPLTGGHSNVDCKQCHTNGSFNKISTDCVSCHADPGFHAGAFGINCASCHTTQAWSPAGFNFNHPEPRVEEGGSGVNHGGATCRQCHTSTVFQATCTACHEGNPGSEGGGDD